MAGGFTKGASAANGRRRANIAYGKLSATRKLLRRLPDELTAPIRKVVAEGARKIEQDAKAAAPRSDGPGPHAADAIRHRLGRDGFTAEVGLIGKRANRKGFYLRFAEYGTKGTDDGFGKGIALPPQPARPWLAPAFDANAKTLREQAEAFINRAINTAASVATTDLTSATGSLGVTDG